MMRRILEKWCAYVAIFVYIYLLSGCSTNDFMQSGEQTEGSECIAVAMDYNPYKDELNELEKHIFVDSNLDGNVPTSEYVFEKMRNTYFVDNRAELDHTDIIYNSDFLPAYLKALVVSEEGTELLSVSGFDSLSVSFPSVAFYLMYDSKGGVCVVMMDGENMNLVHYSCPAMVSKQCFSNYEQDMERLYEERVQSWNPYSINTVSFSDFDSITNKKWHDLANQEKTSTPDDFYKLKVHNEVYSHTHTLVDSVYCAPIIPSKVRLAQKKILPEVEDSVAGSIAVSIVKLLYTMNYLGTINGISFDVSLFKRGLTLNMEKCASYFYNCILNSTNKTQMGFELLQNCGFICSVSNKEPYEYVDLLKNKKVLIAVDNTTGAWSLIDGVYEKIYSCNSSTCNIAQIHVDRNGMNAWSDCVVLRQVSESIIYEY